MKSREFSIRKMVHWHSIGCAAGGMVPAPGPVHYVEMVPTVDNVRGIIAWLFPGSRLDERWQSVKEQITDGLEIGAFSVDLFTPEIDSSVETYSISFDEMI